MKPFTVELRPVRSEKVSPQEYLKLLQECPGLVERAQFVPPKPGEDRDFGEFFVNYTRARQKSPIYG